MVIRRAAVARLLHVTLILSKYMQVSPVQLSLSLTLVFLTLHRSHAFRTCLRLTRNTRCSRLSLVAPWPYSSSFSFAAAVLSHQSSGRPGICVFGRSLGCRDMDQFAYFCTRKKSTKRLIYTSVCRVKEIEEPGRLLGNNSQCSSTQKKKPQKHMG